jgi:hypothetical protein
MLRRQVRNSFEAYCNIFFFNTARYLRGRQYVKVMQNNFLNENESTRQQEYSDEHKICVMLIEPVHVSFSSLYNTFILPVIRCLKITHLYSQRNGI